MTRPIVRPATRADLEAVAQLFDAYRQFYRKPSDPDGARAFIRERLEAGDSLILLALDERGQAVGFTQLYPTFSSVRMRRVWTLNDLFVEPTVRGQGVGRALMEAARQHAEAAGVVALALATEKDNHAAKALYESLDYQIDRGFDYYECPLESGA